MRISQYLTETFVSRQLLSVLIVCLFCLIAVAGIVPIFLSQLDDDGRLPTQNDALRIELELQKERLLARMAQVDLLSVDRKLQQPEEVLPEAGIQRRRLENRRRELENALRPAPTIRPVGESELEYIDYLPSGAVDRE
jgi:hypothetical protein